MPETTAHVRAVLMDDLAHIALEYFGRPSAENESAALSAELGQWEACANQSDQNVDRMFNGACKGDHVRLAKWLIRRGALDYHIGLLNAVEGGHKELADLMIANGANDWRSSFVHACKGGHLEMIEYIIARGAMPDWNLALKFACYYNHRHIADLAIANGADDWDNGLHYACINNSWEFINMMIAKGATHCHHCGADAKDHQRGLPKSE